MQLTTRSLTTASIATAVLATGAPPITTTTAPSSTSSTVSSLSSAHSGASSPPPKPQGTGSPGGGSPQQGGRPQVHIIVETPASDDACGKGTNTTILVPFDGVYTNRAALGKVAALYLTGVTGGNPGPRLEDISCVPVPLPAGGVPGAGSGKPPGGGAPGGSSGAITGHNATSVNTPSAPAPTPIKSKNTPPGSPPPPPAQSSQVPASGVEGLGVPVLVSAALFGVLGIMFTL
ncbi:uncharacterized protein PG986_004204 [Apiospora aurea]|uniref:Uncharacterized protein n=1 Tax=Apiospora aurea TaxID=335848 RepID=A0ABR1QMN8_9PEZI